MRLLLPISVSLLLLALPAAHAQTADDFFNGGAQSYISNNIPQAVESVAAGLKQYPDDVKLKKLYELLKQQQNQQNQQNQSDQQQSKNDQSQQQKQNSSSQQNQSQQSQQQTRQNSQPNQQQNQQAQNQQPPQAPSSQPKSESGDKENGAQQAANTAKTMTAQEAKQLLNAQKGDEQVLQLKPKGSPPNFGRPFKDW
jgi:Ca-activated chloride channel family protein